MSAQGKQSTRFRRFPRGVPSKVCLLLAPAAASIILWDTMADATVTTLPLEIRCNTYRSSSLRPVGLLSFRLNSRPRNIHAQQDDTLAKAETHWLSSAHNARYHTVCPVFVT